MVNRGSQTGRRNEVLAGNHTLMAARSLGWDTIDVGIVDVDEDTARSIVAADNRLADLGGTGYALDDLLAMERDLFPPEPLTDPDDVPPTPESPVSRPGQLWSLG
ncbi:hypothetical protein [Mycobacterium sp. D16Q16]|uniref:hypothetical protein n=1 Tax=Mycobacterium sp. D16Q16 TaxID=1855659 RepID=UPI00257045F9|nr:hypothetical protein [Mycobacterium sp. D16Q16]